MAKSKKTTKKVKKELVTECLDLGVIMTPEECKTVADQVLEYRDLGIINMESDARYYKGSHGGIAPISYDFMGKFLPLVRELVGKKVVFANPFCRIYNNGSTLNPHTDRDVLDWTISVCVKTDIDWDWPLKTKTSNKKVVSVPTRLGHASLVRGNVYTHWREPLVCEDHENVICMFLHYTNPDNPALTQEITATTEE